MYEIVPYDRTKNGSLAKQIKKEMDMDMVRNRVSICIISYNNERYLDCCIQSALNQTDKNVEVILVDDRSTDRSWGIAQHYSDKIKIFRNETNLGEMRNCNRALELCSGEFVTILHSDDALRPEFCEKLSKILINNPNVVMAAGERSEIDENGVIREIPPFYDDDYIIPSEKQAKVFLFSNVSWCQGMYRRTALDQVGGIPLRINPDGLLQFTICYKCGDYGYLKDQVALYRIHNTSASSTWPVKMGINFPLEMYGTLREKMKIGAGSEYLRSFYPQVIKKFGEMVLKYCVTVLESGDRELLRRYMYLALVFDLDLEKSANYQALQSCLESSDSDPVELYRSKIGVTRYASTRKTYDAPEGSVKMVR